MENVRWLSKIEINCVVDVKLDVSGFQKTLSCYSFLITTKIHNKISRNTQIPWLPKVSIKTQIVAKIKLLILSTNIRKTLNN